MSEGLKTGQKIEQYTNPEVLKTPEIVIQEERGAQLFSILLKAENQEWGETETSLAKETVNYFKNKPINPEILKTIRNFYKEGVDEETLYNLALTYQHPERAEKVFEMAAKYKPHVKNLQEKHQAFLVILEKFDQDFSASPLVDKFTEALMRDKEERLKRMGETRKRVETIINFFKPDPKTTDVKKLLFVPTDPLYKSNSGRNFSAFPGEQIIISHVDNILNQNHEFSHGIINPIVEKLSERLTDEQKDEISRLASKTLKQDYGDEYFSLLCEEFIRTYTELVSKGEVPQTYGSFMQKINNIDEDQFQRFFTQSESSKTKCDELGINSITELKNQSKKYFERFEKNRLKDLIFKFYQEYLNRSNKENENFERFVLERFPKLL